MNKSETFDLVIKDEVHEVHAGFYPSELPVGMMVKCEVNDHGIQNEQYVNSIEHEGKEVEQSVIQNHYGFTTVNNIEHGITSVKPLDVLEDSLRESPVLSKERTREAEGLSEVGCTASHNGAPPPLADPPSDPVNVAPPRGVKRGREGEGDEKVSLSLVELVDRD